MTFARSMIQEVLPVRDVAVKVQVPEGKTVTRVYLAPGEEELKFDVNSGFVEVLVPELGVHRMVVIDYE